MVKARGVLDDWLRARNCSDADLARKLHVSTQAVQLWRHALRRPSRIYAMKIEELTDGAVTGVMMESDWNNAKKEAV